MINSVVLLWAFSTSLNLIWVNILMYVTLPSKHSNKLSHLLYTGGILCMFSILSIWYSNFINDDSMPILFVTLVSTVEGLLLYKSTKYQTIFMSITMTLIAIVITFITCGTLDSIIGYKLGLINDIDGPYTTGNILLFICIKVFIATITLIIYTKFFSKKIYPLLEVIQDHIKDYIIIPSVSLISFILFMFISNSLGIIPGHKLFIPLYVIICSIYIISYYTLATSVYWTNKAISAEQIMYIDGLTGLYNRTAFDKYEEKLNQQIKDGTAIFALAIIDLNFLKKLNDTYGHEKGDIALKILADDIKTIFTGCKCFRIGGDEFAVIMSSKNMTDILFLFSMIGASISKTGKPNEWENISAATGYTTFNANTDKSFHDVFIRADAIMYENKKKMKACRED